MPLRLIFMGTPDFSVPTLGALHDAGHNIVAVYTREPAPAGRRLILQPSPVAEMARQLGIPTFTPKTLRTPKAIEEFSDFHADAAVVVAYGLILPAAILDAPTLGCFNLHGSLLPRWRGAAPIERAVMAGDAETGVMVMKMDVGLDTGDLVMADSHVLAELVSISDEITSGELRRSLAVLGARLMVRAMEHLERHQLFFREQLTVGTSYASKIDKSETRIDWTRPAHEVLRHIHGLSPDPAAWCEMPVGNQMARVRILRCTPAVGQGLPGQLLDDKLTVACGEGAIRILELQRAGRDPMGASVFQSAARLRPPLRLY